MSDAIRWGFLSTANINDKLLPGAAASDRLDVVAVASRDAARAETYARERGIERAYGSYDAPLADPDVEELDGGGLMDVGYMSDAIRGRAEPLLGREDALGQARALDAFDRAAAEGAKVTV